MKGFIIEDDLHKEIKTIAKMNNITMKCLTDTILRKFVSDHKSNKYSIQTITRIEEIPTKKSDESKEADKSKFFGFEDINFEM